jgi:hypothetical protein
MRRTLCLEGALVDGGASPVVEGELGHAAELELELAGREEHEVLHRYDVVEALEKCHEALPADIHGALLEAEPEELIDVAAGDGNTGAARFQFALDEFAEDVVLDREGEGEVFHVIEGHASEDVEATPKVVVEVLQVREAEGLAADVFQ